MSLLWCVCSACPGTPAVFPLRVMQLAALLRFHSWLTQVGCPTPAVMVSHGVGVVLVQMSCYPLVFLLCDCAASPSAASPSRFCTLDGCVSLSDSSLLVYSWGWVWRGLAASSSTGPAEYAVFPAAGSLKVFGSPGVCISAILVTWVGLQPFPSFSGLLLLRLLAGVVGVLHPVSGCSS